MDTPPLCTFSKQPKLHDRYEPEIQLALQSLMFSLSVWKTGATYGLQLMGLKYRDERQHWRNPVKFEDAEPTIGQKLGWWLGHVGIRYIWARIQRVSLTEQWSELDEVPFSPLHTCGFCRASSPPPRLSHELQDHWKRKVWVWMQRLETLFNVFTLLNFMAFLSNGR